MRSKKWSWVALVFAVALIAAACGDDDSSTTTSPDAPATTAASGGTETTAAAAEALRIAVVSPSSETDLAFTQSIVDAVNVIAAERGIPEENIDVTENMFNIDDAAAALRDYASQGFDLVIAHGSQYGGSLEEIAPDFPDVSFAWGTAADTKGLDNVFAYEAASDEGGYVLGVMAAALTESNIIGVVGPIEVGDAKLYVDGFVAGAEANNSGATVRVVYTDSFSDVALASEAAQAHVAAGADAMSGTAQMVVGAVSVANDEGVLWFGTQANQSSLGDIVVASQVYKWEVILRDILDNIDNGVLGGEIYVVDLENGGEVIEFNDAYDLPADVRQLAEDTIAGIIDGSISTGG
ncbi:MAG: BMP family ABC transporter substrate-binding protein [Acidimicrobiia bacterium]|nr:BMP family ABC transporter substrate-binding protein [Acidimicrobiia bacterium]